MKNLASTLAAGLVVFVMAILFTSVAYISKADAGVTITSADSTFKPPFMQYDLTLLANSTGSVACPYPIYGYIDNVILIPGVSVPPSIGTTVKLYDPTATAFDWLGDILTTTSTTAPFPTAPYHNSQYGPWLVFGAPTITVGSNTTASATFRLLINVIERTH